MKLHYLLLIADSLYKWGQLHPTTSTAGKVLNAARKS